VRTALILLAACGGPATEAPPPVDHGDSTPAALADENAFRPSYGKSELQSAIIAERAKEATAERDAATRPEDLAVRRRFIAALEACQDRGHACPPRLDEPAWTWSGEGDPTLEVAVRFDLADWQKVAAELHGRACACRTLACVDGIGDAIDQLSARPMPDVQADETATQSITWARECLFRLRGRSQL
jgi:hypothetical protein